MFFHICGAFIRNVNKNAKMCLNQSNESGSPSGGTSVQVEELAVSPDGGTCKHLTPPAAVSLLTADPNILLRMKHFLVVQNGPLADSAPVASRRLAFLRNYSHLWSVITGLQFKVMKL